jgi:hypothetical protein
VPIAPAVRVIRSIRRDDQPPLAETDGRLCGDAKVVIALPELHGLGQSTPRERVGALPCRDHRPARDGIAKRGHDATVRCEYLRRGALTPKHGARHVEEIRPPFLRVAARHLADRRMERAVRGVGQI